MRILQIGNFEPPFSTENDLHHALTEDLGHEVTKLQEQHVERWESEIGWIFQHRYDAVLWTSTYGLAAQVPDDVQRKLQYAAADAGISVYGFHLDRWWGLQRWHQVLTRPFFRSTQVFTADGHHHRQWHLAGVNHTPILPGVSTRWLGMGEVRQKYATEIAFVGNHLPENYHPEWNHRPALVEHLKKTYGRRVAFYPAPGQHAIRGRELNDLYASARVVVGDSCLVPGVDGRPMTKYCSDRIPETLGRGGLLVHPQVEGITYPPPDEIDLGYPYRASEHLLTFPLFDFKSLDLMIEAALSGEFEHLRQNGIEHVERFHTYSRRMEAIFGCSDS